MRPNTHPKVEGVRTKDAASKTAHNTAQEASFARLLREFLVSSRARKTPDGRGGLMP